MKSTPSSDWISAMKWPMAWRSSLARAPWREMTDAIYQSGQEENAPSLTAKLEYEAHVEPEAIA